MRTFGLIGYPLTHSFSRNYFADKFQKENITDCEYKLFPLEDVSLFPALIKNNSQLSGLNVTIPFKQSIIPYLDKSDAVAEKINAVNTIKITRKGNNILLTGFNTDAWGFEQSLKPLLLPHHTDALILGTGGSAQAVQFVLSKLGIRFHIVSRKSKDKLVLKYENVSEETLLNHKLLINTTPLGMHPDVKSFPPVPYEYLSPSHLLFDLVYNPSETLFLKKGKEKGAQIKNGLEMLYLQADKSWEIWNNDSSI